MLRLDWHRIDIESVLDYYGIKNIKNRGEEVQFSCPFPEHKSGDRHPSSSVNTENGKYHCYSCGRSGKLTTFISEIEEIPLQDAARKLRQAYNAEYNESASLKSEFEAVIAKHKVLAPRTKQIPEEAIALFYVDWNLAFDAYENGTLPKRLSLPFKRGISVESLVKYQIGFDPYSRRISIPIRNESGVLVGFKGRSTSPIEEPRYLSIGDRLTIRYGFPTHKNSKYVYGLNSTKTDEVIVVEGEFDKISMEQRGFDSTIAIGGSNPSKEQIDLIRSNCSRVILMLDPDEAGKKAERKLKHNLIDFIPVKIAKLVGKDPNQASTEEIKQALSKARNPLIKHI